MIRILRAAFLRLKKICFKSILASLHCIALLFKPFLKSKHIWLLLERGIDAQDNAWHLFKYLRDNYPSVNALYAIKRSSHDYRKNLSQYSDVVIEYGSFKYFMHLFNAKYIVSTHIQSYSYFHSVFNWLQHSCFDVKGKKIFLQHGCIHNFHPSFEYPYLKVDLFITGAKNEHELLLNQFHYPPTIAVYTGLARFDNLHNTHSKNTILIMPTWRSKYAGYSREQFESTDFYKEYAHILTDSRLIQCLEEYNYRIIFYNHIEFQKFNPCFESYASQRVQIAKFGEESVQSLLKEAKLLITDYSSVYYDFFYMKKPIVFFKLNQEAFQTSQYGEDYDDPLNFGIVTYTSKDVCDTVIKTIHDGLSFDVKYNAFHSSIFPLYDVNNRKRIYDAIVDL